MLATAQVVQAKPDENKPGGGDSVNEDPPKSAELRARLKRELEELLGFVDESAGHTTFDGFQRKLLKRVSRLGRLLVAFFLCMASERLEVPERVRRGRRQFRRQPAKPRKLGTFFGKVRYWRFYLHQSNGHGGYFPLDLQLGLTADGFSIGLLSRATQLATKMSFAAAAHVMAAFLGWAPATKTIERAVLGLGRHTGAWFESGPPPDDDGQVLVIQIDSKAAPTARAEELKKRRGKRKKRAKLYRNSARHRGRETRSRWTPKTRRKKGDKSKNGKMATLVTMYTLDEAVSEDGSALLLGPKNRWVYASFAPKRHAVAIARREATRRGFGPDSGKTIQVVTDGDQDLQCYIEELFPSAIHTLDIMHVIERLWTAGNCRFPEGSSQLTDWVESKKEQLYGGKIEDIILDLEGDLFFMEAGSKFNRLDQVINYLSKRTEMMNYAELAEQDLELASGAVEGAVRYVISQRFDEGGMRWIKERAEALLQLRCIEINGHWEDFIAFAHHRIEVEQKKKLRAVRLLRSKANPLPSGVLPCQN